MAMTASVTRSRRVDGLQLSQHRLVPNAKAVPNSQQYAPINHPPRAKRPLDAPERDFDAVVAKRAKFTTGIAVEIPSRPPLHPSARPSREPDAKSSCPKPPAPTQSRAPPARTPSAAAAAAAAAAATAATHGNAQQQPTVTKHQEKVANGLKHELNKLQANAVDTKDQGRKLRSQEAHFKSELSSFFADYDEVIGNDPKEHHILNHDTPIVVTGGENPQPPRAPATYPVRSYADSLFTDLTDSQRIDFSFLNKGTSLEDPLPDALFEPAHRKAERLERSIRNSEKGRAQHERDQIVRLLDGLQGHNWLRVMGVSGITESRKKAFEPAREHFIKGCQAILEKFRRWAAEEKRRKLEKDRAAANAGRQAEREAAASEEKEKERGRAVGAAGKRSAREKGGGGGREIADSDADAGDDDADNDGDAEGEPPDDSDVDASVAKQLREEALAAAAAKKKASATSTSASSSPPSSSSSSGSSSSRRGGRRSGRGGRGGRAAAATASKTQREPPRAAAPAEFKSFFAKPYQREAALNRDRRRGRKVLAWGHPVPDMAEADFELPAEFRDEHTLRSHARRKRRDRRGRH